MKKNNRLIVKAGQMLCGDDLTPEREMALVIENGVIKDIKPLSEIGKAVDVEWVDCSDKTLMPGLIDAHNHLSLDIRLPDYLERMTDPIPALTIRAVKTLKDDLLAGVTTTRCLGDKGFLDIECRKATETGYISGPRLVLSGKGIRSSAGHGFVGDPFDGPDMIRKAVRDNIRMGADIIKFYVTGTLPANGEIVSFLSRKEIEIIVEEAKRIGCKTAVHCVGGIGFDWCIAAGVDVIEHGYFLTRKQIERLSDSGAQLVLTPSFYMSNKRIRTLPKHLVAPHLDAAAQAKASMSAIVKSEISYAVGTDGVHGKGAMAKEIACLLELGLSPQKAISVATLSGAKICGLDKITGSIEVGKSADLIGTKTNPLKDCGTLSEIQCIILQGDVIKNQ